MSMNLPKIRHWEIQEQFIYTYAQCTCMCVYIMWSECMSPMCYAFAWVQRVIAHNPYLFMHLCTLGWLHKTGLMSRRVHNRTHVHTHTQDMHDYGKYHQWIKLTFNYDELFYGYLVQLEDTTSRCCNSRLDWMLDNIHSPREPYMNVIKRNDNCVYACSVHNVEEQIKPVSRRVMPPQWFHHWSP